jgi:hypothetical protein
MRKGATPATLRRLIADTQTARIATVVNIILGYPSETWDEMKQSIDFLFAMREHIVRSNLLPFFFKANTAVLAECSRFPVHIKTPEDEDLVVFHEHEYLNGIRQQDINRLCEQVEATLADKCPIQRFVGEIGQHPAAFFYFSRFGSEKVCDLADQFYSGSAAAANGSVRLSSAIWLCSVSERLRSIGAIASGAPVAVYDARSECMSWVSPFSARVLARCIGGATRQELAAEFADTVMPAPLVDLAIAGTIMALPPGTLT